MQAIYTYFDTEKTMSWSGFNSSKDLASSIELSMIYARKQFDKIKLVTNTFGKSILVDYYGLKFDEVDLTLNQYESECSRFWSFAKMVSYSIQKEKFVHIDNDVYIIEKIKTELFDCDFLFQNEESFITHAGYQDMINKLRIYKSSIPDSFIKTYHIKNAYNCGIVYSRKIDACKLWFNLALEFINDKVNDSFIKSNGHYINHCIEQLFISMITANQKHKVNVLIKDFRYKDINNNTAIVHLWGSAKREEAYMSKVAELLQRNGSNVLYKEPIKSEEVTIEESFFHKETGDIRELKNALVISLRRNFGTRLSKLKKSFKFNINLNVIEGIDGLRLQIPKHVTMKAGTYGCLLSHIKSLEYARDKNMSCVLILEDDVRFVDDFENKLELAMSELPEDWDMLWLGGSDQILPERYSDNLDKLVSSWGAYGYIMRNTVYDFFIDIMKSEQRPSDDYYRLYQSQFNSFRSKFPLIKHQHVGSVRESTDKASLKELECIPCKGVPTNNVPFHVRRQNGTPVKKTVFIKN